ncbi:MAG: hypothetical protein L6V95_01320 [Candidatus Melainabacteria bacterium]|nr:MAG: hypothetical protein L6V95_01320 [Candidatus Melainabacteria bacterium]
MPDINLEASYNLGGREFTADYGYAFGGSMSYPVVNLMKLKNKLMKQKPHTAKMKATMKCKNKMYIWKLNKHI